METPFQLNLSKLTLDGLRAQQEQQALLARDIEAEIVRRRDEALNQLVDDMWKRARELGFSDKQVMAALSPKVKKAYAEATAIPATTSTEGPRDKPQVGETYANPNDPAQSWTKTTRLGAPARWLHALVMASEARTYEQFRVK